MSLRPEDRSSRTRSRSRSGRERSRSRSHARAASPAKVSRAGSGYMPTKSSIAMPEMPGDSTAAGANDVRSRSSVLSPAAGYLPTGSDPPGPGYPSAKGFPYPVAGGMAMPYPVDDGGFTTGGYADLHPHEQPEYHGQQGFERSPRDDKDDGLAYGSEAVRSPRESISRHGSYASTQNYRYAPSSAMPDSRGSTQQYQYAAPPEKILYRSKPQQSGYGSPLAGHDQKPPHQLPYPDMSQGQPYSSLQSSYQNSAYGNAQVVEVMPVGRHDQDRKTSKSHRLTVSTEQSSLAAPRSPGLGPRMDRLSVSGQRPDLQTLGVGMSIGSSGALPPPSPLLEAYHGTYQSISPMPLAIRMNDSDSELDDLPTLDGRPQPKRSSSSTHSSSVTTTSTKKRVAIYDPTADAKTLASALSHSRPHADPLIEILPHLSHDQILAVRREYKKSVKIHGHGINLSKHIKTKFAGNNTNFGKVAYITALGRWESEGYWANFWYQSHSSRRELLIESLMGRTNAEIRMIKDDFKDKRYGDNLVSCLEQELKWDKFRVAVLIALEGRRQEEQDVYPAEYILRDVDTLHRAVSLGPKGGESAMLEICLRRSDAHLKAVLQQYNAMYGENFARVALQRSGNLVGEVLAHVLNGAINKPARDAALLRHALRDVAEKNCEEELRFELLISRLVRCHWDGAHLGRVKREFWTKGKVTLEDAVEDTTRGEFGEFLVRLCEGGK